jgi:hypothetical protein
MKEPLALIAPVLAIIYWNVCRKNPEENGTNIHKFVCVGSAILGVLGTVRAILEQAHVEVMCFAITTLVFIDLLTGVFTKLTGKSGKQSQTGQWYKNDIFVGIACLVIGYSAVSLIRLIFDK